MTEMELAQLRLEILGAAHGLALEEGQRGADAVIAAAKRVEAYVLGNAAQESAPLAASDEEGQP